MCLAIPGEVLTIERIECAAGLTLLQGDVRFGTIVAQVNLTLVPEVQPGDFVLSHVGCAIARIDTGAAQRTLSELEALQSTIAQSKLEGSGHD